MGRFSSRELWEKPSSVFVSPSAGPTVRSRLPRCTLLSRVPPCALRRGEIIF